MRSINSLFTSRSGFFHHWVRLKIPKKYFSILMTSFIVNGGLYCQQPVKVLRILTLNEAWDYAIKNNPDQKSYILNNEKAKADLHSSESYLWPIFGGNLAGQLNTKLPTTVVPGEIFGKPGQTMNVQFGQKYNYNTGLTASKTILDWQHWIQVKIAKNDLLTTQLETDAYKQNLKQQVALYYYSVAVSQEALNLYKQNLLVADSTVIITDQKFRQGIINSISSNLSVISCNNIHQQILNTEILLDQCKNSLKILLGIEKETDLEIDTTGLMKQFLPVDVQNLGKDKNLAIQENQIRSTELKVNLQKSSFVPKMNLYGYYGLQQYRNDFGISFNNNKWFQSSYVGVDVQVPIFSGFLNRNKLKSSKIEYKKSQTEWDESERKAAMNDELLINEFKKSQQMLQPVSENFNLYRQNQQMTYNQLKEGLISMDYYFKTVEDYLNSENSYLNALSVLYTYYSTIISRQ